MAPNRRTKARVTQAALRDNEIPSPQSEKKVRHSSDITERLTITINGPESNNVDSDADGSALGEIPSAEEALAIRPRLDDPTTLMNGNVHPRYVGWMTKYTWSERHPLHEYLSSKEHLRLLTDERGYFDRKRVNRSLGPSGSKFWLADGPLPSKAKIPLLAHLLQVPVDEVQAAVDQERSVRQEYQSVVSSCRSLPYRLLTYEQIRAGVPCPGCGRPWVGPQNDVDSDPELWRALHAECRAGRNGYNDSPIHCMRCCGVPPASPEQLAAVLRILKDAADDRERRTQLADNVSPETSREQQGKAALRRAARIRKLEAELERLKAEEGTDSTS